MPNLIHSQTESHSNSKVKTVLVVDDERLNRMVLRTILRKNGIETVQACDGAEAIEAIKSQEFDMVLLDIYMPRMDGFETLQQIRQIYKANELPVIMVTADNESTQIVRAFQMGANDYIAKPIDRLVTMARIRMHLQFADSRRALKSSEERYSLVARGTNDGLWDWDLCTNEIFYSPRWISMLGIEDDSVSCSPELWFSRIHPEDLSRVQSQLENHKRGQSSHFEAELRMRHSNGSFRWMRCRGLAVSNQNGEAVRIAGSLTDITEGKVADALTGLPNRVLFRERLERCSLKQKREKNSSFSVLYLDLDNFKQVNDSLGHEAGDRLLVAIARRLENSLRTSDSFVCRLGGDEFSILLEGISSPEQSVQVARRIVNSINSPIALGGGREVFASVSVGVCNSNEKFYEPKEIIQSADTAMYRAKESGKSCYCVFDPAMKESVCRKSKIETELRRAIDREELFLHYQPMVDLRNLNVIGFEALVRWDHATLGAISPAEFVSVAKESGLIVEMGRQVLRQACLQMAEWKAQDQRFQEMVVSVNWTHNQLLSSESLDDLRMILEEVKLKPSDLQIEVTEAMIMDDLERGGEAIIKLKSLGVTIAVDDFGTGFSSLSTLQKLSLNAVKIDASFIDQMASSKDQEAVVRTLIAMADGLGVNVIAEGVESETQRKMLNSMGCSLAQGFLFSKPLCPAAIQEMVLSDGPVRDTAVVAIPKVTTSSIASVNETTQDV